MTKEQRICNGERIISSINDAGKTRHHMEKNETTILQHTEALSQSGLNTRM